ncbi:MAG TPA: hypothetical protein VMF05_12050 [Stellaceae bacterium]|nr:hypothetical protein [Stellaceae bacterium]
MKGMPVLAPDRLVHPQIGSAPDGNPAGPARRAGGFVLRELREMLPPFIFFFVGFNLIVLTTNLLLADYHAQFASFLLATGAALVVGKAVLVANAMHTLRRYDRAPLLRPILFKTVFYWAVVFVARLLEHFIKYWLVEHHPLGSFLPHMVATFSWDRFAAIQIWIAVLFLVYVTASEINHLFGEGELGHILCTSRPAELPLNRRQRILELVRLSQLADAHSIAEFSDLASPAHNELIEIVRRLARDPQPRPSIR